MHLPRFREAPWATQWIKIGCLVLLSGLLAANLRGQGVVLHLQNGDRLTGTLLSESATNLVLSTQFGEVSIATEWVQRREDLAPPKPPTLTPDELREALATLFQAYQKGEMASSEYHARRAELMRQAAQAGIEPSRFTLSPTPPSLPIPKAGAKPKPKSKWTGQAQLGADLGFGTKDRELFSSRINVTYARDRFKNNADYRFAYGETDDELSANRMDGSMKTDWDLTKTHYVYNLGGAGYDEVRLIDLRYEVGPGLGTHAWRGKNYDLSLELGVNYYVEEREDRTNLERFYYRLAQILTWKVNSRINVDEKFEWFPQVEAPDQYRFRFESNVQYLLGANLNLVFTVLDQYETDTPDGVDNNDLQIRSSVGLKF